MASYGVGWTSKDVASMAMCKFIEQNEKNRRARNSQRHRLDTLRVTPRPYLRTLRYALGYLKHGKSYGIDGVEDWTSEQIRNRVCTYFSVSTLHYNSFESEWAKEARCPTTWLNPNETKKDDKRWDCDAQASKSQGAHSKWWSVDGKAFYIGSQNLYPNNLAEWGMVIDDEVTTMETLQRLWDPIWSSSARFSPSGPGANLTQCLSEITIPFFPLLAEKA